MAIWDTDSNETILTYFLPKWWPEVGLTWHTVTKLDFSSKKAQNLLTRFLKFLGPKPSLHYVGSYYKKKLQGLFHKKIHNFNFSEPDSLLP